MGMRSRRKGKVGEREAAELLRELYPEAARTISQARGAEACDVEGTPWWVEVKVGAKPNPLAALLQAKLDAAAAGDDRPPLVIARRDREGTTVTLAWSDFAALVRANAEARRTLVRTAKALRCAKLGCASSPVLPSAWCVFHEPYDETAREKGRMRPAPEGE